MQPTHLAGVSLLAVLFAACASGVAGTSGELAYATATPACGPTDGPAVSIYLSPAPVESFEPPAPYVRLSVWQPPERLAGRSWELAGDGSEGGAWYFTTARDFEVATGGSVRIGSVSRDNTIEGVVDVTFPGTGRIRREFRAVWVPRSLMCG